ncbi:MAG: TolC family protein, partial [Candidatus Gastranaerophilaceae bacterium]
KAKGGYGLNANSNTTNSFQFQGTLDFSAINAMDIKYKIDEAKAKLDIAENAVDQLSKDIYYSVQSAYVNMVQLEKKIPLTEVNVKQTFENLELAMGRYEVGLGNFLEVQDAIVNYNKAQENYVKLIFDFNVAMAKLELEIAKIDKKDNSNNG